VTDGTARLSWSAPKSDGGAPISNYIIEMRRSHEYKWQQINVDVVVTSTDFAVPGLSEEVEFVFRVTAVNKAGPGKPSEPSDKVKYSKFSIFNLSFLSEEKK
jgi:titin